jgi:hypothetical protein
MEEDGRRDGRRGRCKSRSRRGASRSLERRAAWAQRVGGTRGGDEGGVSERERSLHVLRAPAMLGVVRPVPDRNWLLAE